MAALTKEAFDALLAFLHPDPRAAASEYLKLRQRLVHFFEWRGCPGADDCADETLDRVARKAAAGFETPPAKPYTFVHAVAINVARESWRSPGGRETPLDASAPSLRAIEMDAAAASEKARRLDCLDRALERLPRASRELLLEYHRSSSGTNIGRRLRMAQTLNVPVTALRLRVFRLRRQLAASVRQCLENGQGEMK